MAAPARSVPIASEEQLSWLALKLVPGLGVRAANRLVERYRSAQAVFRATRSELEASGVSSSVAQSLASGTTFDEAADQHQAMLKCGADLIPITDPRYPPMLREIFDPPIVLFVRGRVDLLQTVSIGVVGSRRPTTYGVVATEKLSSDLSDLGLTIVSGMARGIDTAAHKATLAARGNTIAVFGCGVDVLYPAENRKLMAQIEKEGLLLSEFPMGTAAYPQNFPIRNRIVAGIGVGVLVVEGAQYSGSSITARLALDQNREVFAVPGNITSRLSWGPNLLIKQGAKLIQEAADVLIELNPDVRLRVAAQSRNGVLLEDASVENKGPEFPDGPLGQVCRAVFGGLKPDQATQLDQLLESLEQYSSSELIAGLFELEMSGAVRQLPGKNFVRIWNR